MQNPDIHIQYLNHLHANEIALSRTEYRRYQFPSHFHEHYTVILIGAGVNEGFTERERYKVGKGGILIINPGELHAGTSFNNEYLKFYSIRISKGFLHKLCNAYELNQKGDIIFNQRPIYFEPLVQRMRRFIQVSTLQKDANIIEINYLEFFFDLLNQQSNQYTQEETLEHCNRVKSAYCYIQDNYKNEISLQELANASNMSRYHFIRSFKKSYGLSPFQFIRNLRVEKAKELIMHGYPITQAAVEVGFFDHSHFLRNFKKLEGITPSSFISNKKIA